MNRFWSLRAVFACLLFLSGVGFVQAGSYEAPLPVRLSTDPDLCAQTPCEDVIDADSFSLRMGRPAYVEAYKTKAHEEGEKGKGKGKEEGKGEHKEGKGKGKEERKGKGKEKAEKELVGYVFLSTDIVDIPAYSGKPVVTLIGMDTKGIVTGVKILKHSEPILLVGIPEAELTKFTDQYLGKFVGDKIEIGASREGYIGVDAISGATVTVIAENQVILRSGYNVAKQVGIIKAKARPAAKLTPVDEMLTWPALIKQGLVKRLTVAPSDVGVAGVRGEPHIDMYFGYLNVPTVGKSILGEHGYRRLMADLKPNDHALFVIANGTASFKGSGFVRGGIYDRIQVTQENDSFTFRDTDYFNLYSIEAAGAPDYRESGIFIVRDVNFSAAYPWNLVFLANKVDRETGAKTFLNFDREYWLPDRYLEGGRPAFERPEPTWLRVWKARKVEIGLFVLWLIAVAGVYSQRDKLVRRANHKDKRWVMVPKYFFWLTSIGFVGFYAMAQPSVTHVLTWFHSLVYQWKWELFLSDPIIFIFWWFIIISVFIWGRGLFCGWLCPYGALSEVAYNIAGKLGLKRFQFALPKPLHDKLKWTKYIVFAVLLAVSFYAMGTAEKMAEIEPFKTTFLVGVWNRAWPFALFWAVLFVAALFVERPFCKYVCPLGAGLGIPSRFRFFSLKRKKECRTCKACANGCSQMAIDAQGRIDGSECLLCQDCMIMYYDKHACPPLAAERKRREKAGSPLTPIGADGYFLPLQELKSDGRKAANR
jgi:NosR/NirI family nitrous oxide reductase transcriptional regulator